MGSRSDWSTMKETSEMPGGCGALSREREGQLICLA
jgi:phosphoribosylcarboxyaminoimidazole (NCAIR) mutase